MTTDEWNRIESIVDRALDLPKGDRDAYITSACGEDPEMMEHVASFLSSVSKADRFFSSSSLTKQKLEQEAVSSDFSTPDYQALIGTCIGAYKLTSILGEGGMGAVFMAERNDGQFEHTAAIKIIQGGLNRPDIYDHFLRERQILAGLNHEFIARLYDGGVAENKMPYLIMEYVDGLPIDRYCDLHHLSAAERLNLFKCVCEATGYAHKNLVIHRDLKPANILITENGTVKVMDFGIAKLTDGAAAGSDIVDESSPRFMTFINAAPEQLRSEPATTATDIYSLGILLYSLLAGVHPIVTAGKGKREIKELILNHVPQSLTNQFSILSPEKREEIRDHRQIYKSHSSEFLNTDLNAIVQKCLKKSANERYQTVEDLLQDLHRYENGFPVKARQGGTVYRVQKFSKRNRGPISAALSLVVLAIISAFFYTYTVQQERDVARMEATKATQMTQFVLNLFKASDPSQTGGSDISARDLLNRGIERTEYLSNQPEIQASMLEVLGRILTQLGEYQEASNLLQQSIDIRQELFGDESLETISGLEQMGILLSARGDLFSAEEMLERALNIREKLQSEHQSAMSEANYELAYVYRRLGKLDEAERMYRSLVEIYETELGPIDPKTLSSLSSLGVTLHTSGDVAEAESIHREVLEKRLDLYDTAHPDIAMSYNNLGALLLNTGNFDESEQMFEKSLEMRRSLFGEIHPKVALTMNNLGILKRNTGQFDEAINLISQSLQINRQLFGKEELQTATNLFSLAELYLMTEKYEESHQYYRRAYGIFSDHLHEETSFTARSLIGIGESAIYLTESDPTTIRRQITEGYNRVLTIHPEQSIEYALATAAMGKMYLYLKQEEEALPYLNQAHTIISDIEGPESIRAQSLANILSDRVAPIKVSR